MRNFYFRKSLAFLRALILLGVLGGLLVSSGEGIRLFPFPFANAEIQESFQNPNKIPHGFNLHRFENERANFHAESHGGKFSPHLTNAFGNHETLLFSPKNVAFQIDEANLFSLLKSRRAGNHRGKRAPPFI